VDVNIVKNDILDIEAFKNWREEFKTAEFILEEGKYICGFAVEKMSKSFYNVVNPDNLIKEYGADTFRVYEMFLGPIEKSKPWNTNGIEGVQRFLNKVWALFFNIQSDKNIVNQEGPSEEEQKIIHKTIKKVRDDMEILSFNTSISALMICVNELGKLNCNKKEILEKLTLLLAPFAPHLAEELWSIGLGNTEGLHLQSFPSHDEKFLVENTYKMPISFNGKMRFVMDIAVGLNAKEIEDLVMANEKTEKWLEGKTIVKKIIVPERIFNIVIK
jgi:leucyl-tRNA synthetase